MKYTDSHEWIKIEGNIGMVGITKYAQKELGEVVHIELPKVDSIVEAGDEVAVLESTKAAADIYSPVSGKVIGVNHKLQEDLSLINRSPEGEGWLFKIKLQDKRELEELHDEKSYLALVCSN
jgi:glycine cleavage system H protein